MLHSAKSKSTHKPKDNDKARLKVACSNAIGGLQTVVQIMDGIASGVGLGPPGLQAGLKGLSLVLNTIQVGLQSSNHTLSRYD
jgi:hypothetical protein